MKTDKGRKDVIHKYGKRKIIEERTRNKCNQNVQDLCEGNLKLLQRETKT